MLSSVQVGIRALPADSAGFFIIPCDLPLVESSTFVALAEAWNESASAVSPVYKGKRGHPVLISSALIPEILGLGPGETLKSALTRYRDRSIEIPVSDHGILLDVDTQEDYATALASLQQ